MCHQSFDMSILAYDPYLPVEIQNRPEGELRAIARNLVERESGTMFILSGGCEITVETPRGNLRALRDASLPPGAGGKGEYVR